MISVLITLASKSLEMNGTVEGNEGSARKRPRAKWPQFPEEVKSTPIGSIDNHFSNITYL